MANDEFTHLNEEGHPGMVDVSGKAVTKRVARAEGIITLGKEILSDLQEQNFRTKKGGVIETAILAGTQAAKKTWDLIPLCHVLPLKGISIEIAPVNETSLRIEAEVKTTDQTGVEMEALTAVSVAALTIYDMCKARSHDIEIGIIRLIHKSGGRSGTYDISV